MKKGLSILLIFIILLTSTVTNPKDVNANPAILLTPKVMATVGTILLAGGVIYHSDDSLRATVADFLYTNSAFGIYDKIKDIDIGTAFTVTADIAQSVWDYIHGRLTIAKNNPTESIPYNYVDGVLTTVSLQLSGKSHDIEVLDLHGEIFYISNQLRPRFYVRTLDENKTYMSDFRQTEWREEYTYQLYSREPYYYDGVAYYGFVPLETTYVYHIIEIPELADSPTYLRVGPYSSNLLLNYTTTAEQTLTSEYTLGQNIDIDDEYKNQGLAGAVVTTAAATTLVGKTAEDIEVDRTGSTDNTKPETKDDWKSVIGGAVSGLLTGLGLQIADSLKPITDFIGDIGNFLDNLVDKLKQMLTSLFLPDVGFFSNFYMNMYNNFNAHVPLLVQLFTLFNTLISTPLDDEIPEFYIDLPEKYGGVRVNIIDFSSYTLVRDIVYNFIRFSLWFFFLWRVIKKITVNEGRDS